jgi:hypothetical protein
LIGRRYGPAVRIEAIAASDPADDFLSSSTALASLATGDLPPSCGHEPLWGGDFG